MISQLRQKLLGYKKVAGVEAVLQQDTIVFNLVLLERSKNKIVLLQKAEGIKTIDELAKLVPANVPISLVVQGRGVVNRKIVDGTYKSEMEILSLILPNSNPDDFYIQQSPSGKFIFVSVARKNTIDDMIGKFSDLSLSVIHLHVGPFSACNLIPFLKGGVSEIYLQNLSLKIESDELVDFVTTTTSQEKDLMVGEEIIKSCNVLPYSIGLTLFLTAEVELSDALLIKNIRGEYDNKMLFMLGGYAVLSFFVIILVLNYLFYSYYKNENAKLANVTSSYQNTIEEIKILEKKIEEKEYFMKSAGWLSFPKTSFYSDEIAASLPGSSIRLTSLKVNPLNDKKSKKEKKEIFQTDTILVAGNCNNPTSINPWMNELKKKEWVKSLSNMNYSYDQKTRTGNFEIEIRTGDE